MVDVGVLKQTEPFESFVARNVFVVTTLTEESGTLLEHVIITNSDEDVTFDATETLWMEAHIGRHLQKITDINNGCQSIGECNVKKKHSIAEHCFHFRYYDSYF